MNTTLVTISMYTNDCLFGRTLRCGGFAAVALWLGFACFALTPQARGACQEGCDLGLLDTFLGDDALLNNTAGSADTAIGFNALFSNTIGGNNTAIGYRALLSNTAGADNTATGASTLMNTTGGNNTATGEAALFNNTTGNNNTAVGFNAGSNQTTGSNNVYIGANINGLAGESNACRIKSIFGQTAANGAAVFITSGNKLGTNTSSKRFKEEIKPMDKASEALLTLKPVTFRYKKAIDPEGKSQFGLVAEDVEKVNPDLVVRDDEGKPYSVRYEAVNAMLLNEFLKEHRKVEEQSREIARLHSALAEQQKNFESRAAAQEKEIGALSAGLQKVSARLESRASATRMAANN